MIRTLKSLNLIFFLVMICINALANILPIGHGNTGEISAKYPNLFTPAPITFSIWGVIYLMVAVFIVYQLGFYGNHTLSEELIKLIGCWFIISCIMNIGWIFSWHYEVTWLSMVFMVGLLISLIVIAMMVSPETVMHSTGMTEMPFSAKISMWSFDVYLGWITAATIANASALLVKVNWNRFGLSEEFWTIIVLIVGALFGLAFILIDRRYMSAAAVVWAYIGILIKHISRSGYGGEYPMIIAVTIICIVAIISAWVISLIVRTME